MALFPPSTNEGYQGAPIAAWFLMFAGVAEFLAGCIHFFLPDGGAGVIAGIDLTSRGQTIVSLFAWVGALQIPLGALLFLIGLRYRTLVPLGLLYILTARALMSYDGWFGKSSNAGHHPPEHFASPVAAGLALLLLVFAMRHSHRDALSRA